MKDLSNLLSSLAALAGAIGGLLAGITALLKLVRSIKDTKEGQAPLPGVALFRTPAFLVGILLILLAVVFLSVALLLWPRPSPAPTLVTTECRLSNLLDCSVPVPIYIPGESLSTASRTSGKLTVDFINKQNLSGVAFQFAPSLDVRDVKYLELTGTSSQAFTFLVEYKVGQPPGIVSKSADQSFPATVDRITIKIPMAYAGSIDEIAINCFGKGQASRLVIESIRLIY